MTFSYAAHEAGKVGESVGVVSRFLSGVKDSSRCRGTDSGWRCRVGRVGGSSGRVSSCFVWYSWGRVVFKIQGCTVLGRGRKTTGA